MWLLWATIAGAAPYGQDDLLTHMEAHFAAATDASWFVALGNLAKVQEQAKKLDHEPAAVIPQAWRPNARRMQRAARSLAASTDIPTAAERVAGLGATCAACHTSIEGGPRLTANEVKMQVLTPLGEHALAPYWLWVGFVMNSDAAWANGAKAFKGAPVAPGTAPFAEAYDALTSKVSAASASEREALMTQILTSCQPCHESAKVKVED